MCEHYTAVSTGDNGRPKVWDGWAGDGEGAWKDEADAGPKKKPRGRPPNNIIVVDEEVDEDVDEEVDEEVEDSTAAQAVESKAHGVSEIILPTEHKHAHTHTLA